MANHVKDYNHKNRMIGNIGSILHRIYSIRTIHSNKVPLSREPKSTKLQIKIIAAECNG